MNIPLQHYLAFNAPNASIGVMKDFGYEVLNVKSKSDIAQCLAQFIKRDGEKALNALAKIHPDRDLILAGNDGIALNADGSADKPSGIPVKSSVEPMIINQKSDTNYIPVIVGGIIASALLVSAAIISKN